MKIVKGNALKEGEKKELKGLEARKEIVDTYIDKLSGKERDKDMREELGFDPEKRKLIRETIEDDK